MSNIVLERDAVEIMTMLFSLHRRTLGGLFLTWPFSTRHSSYFNCFAAIVPIKPRNGNTVAHYLTQTNLSMLD